MFPLRDDRLIIFIKMKIFFLILVYISSYNVNAQYNLTYYLSNAFQNSPILNENKNKRIAIVSHATAISFLIKKWCDIEIINNKLRYSFKNNILLEGHIEYCTGFKLEFAEDNHLINIEFLK